VWEGERAPGGVTRCNRSCSQRLACTGTVGKRGPAFTSRFGGGIDRLPEMEKMNINGYFGQEGKKKCESDWF
jgi:hypothetical protein